MKLLKEGQTIRVTDTTFIGRTGVVTAYNSSGKGMYTVKLDDTPRSARFWFYPEEVEAYDPEAEKKAKLAVALDKITTAARKYPLTGKGEYMLFDGNASKFLDEAHKALLELVGES